MDAQRCMFDTDAKRTRDRRFDHRILQVTAPAGRVIGEVRGAWVPTEEEIALHLPPEGLLHLGERPVPEMDRLEPAHQALGEAVMHQQRGRTEEHDVQRATRNRVLFPQSLHRFRPTDHLLDLIDDQHGALVRIRVGQEPGGLPLLGEPFVASEGRLVGGGVESGAEEVGGHLAHQRGLPDLARATDELDQAARLRQPGSQGVGMRAPKGGEDITHLSEQNYSGA